MDEQVKLGLFFVSLFGGIGMMIAGGVMNGCLRAVGVYPTNCDWTGNPLGKAIQIGGIGVVAVGPRAMFYRRPPKTQKKNHLCPTRMASILSGIKMNEASPRSLQVPPQLR